MLKIVNLTKYYGEKKAVDALTLEILPGQICAFIGHNGAGKTTTLKAAAGILGFDKGEVYIDGVSVKDDPIRTKGAIAYIPDNPDLYDFLSGIKYLNFIADIYGVPRDVRAERIKNYGERIGIYENLSSSISTYSHGMKQKLAVLSAFIHEPKLILMDEPFVGLDPRAAHTLKEMMREHCECGGAIFFSTHVLDVAEKLCDRVAIIKDGKLVVEGDMASVRGDESLESVFLELLEDDNA